ncbi:MAG: galactose-1-phosphate uridylyltransferase [Elusimicrobiota bacterium]
MPQIRQNLATREWVVIATERAKRPYDFKASDKKKVTLPEYSEKCPFCPGNESALAPVETHSIRDKSGKWRVRSIPNKFSALSTDGMPEFIQNGIYRWINGVGIHDVIIETPLHNTCMALFPVEQIVDVLSIYKARYLMALADDRIELVIIFKNHGESAGTSIEHPHSQMIAMPIVPSHIRNRISEAMSYFDDHRECVYCKMIKEEITSGERIINETNNFVCFIPYAALSPFHIWLFPKKHMPSFPMLDDVFLLELATVMKDVLSRLYFGLNDPDYNFVVMSLPGTLRENKFFHWYISFVPRVSKAAGFELGSGMFINTGLPEESAKFLREVKGS